MYYYFSIYFKYFVFLLLIILSYHYIGYPLLLEYTSLSVNVVHGLPYGAVSGDYQKYYQIAIHLLEKPLDINTAIGALTNPNHVAPLILSYVIRLTSCYDSLLCYNLLVTLPISAFIAFQLHAIARRFNIGETKSFFLVCVVLLSPFSLLALTQVSKDLYSHLFYAVSIRTLFSIYDKNFHYSSALSLVLGSIPILFIRPFQVVLSLFVWFILTALLILRERKLGDVIRPGLIIVFLSTIYLLHSQFIRVQVGDVLDNISVLPRSILLIPALPASDAPNSKPSSVDSKPSSVDSKPSSVDSKPSSVDSSSLSVGLVPDAINEKISYILHQVNGYRKYYISMNPDSPMVVNGYVFDSLVDLIYYLPKSFSMVILEPHPFRLLGAKSGHTQANLRLLYMPWAFFVSFLALIVLYKINKSFSFDRVLLLAYTLATLMPYAYFIPNYGNVARYSSFLVAFLFLILIFSKASVKLK